jgi:hypothetical protein
MNHFAPKMELSIPRYDGLIRLDSSFHIQSSIHFLHFCIKMCYNLFHGTSELVEIWKYGQIGNVSFHPYG